MCNSKLTNNHIFSISSPENGRLILFKATRSGIEPVAVVNDDEAALFPDEIELDSDPEVVN